MNYELYMSEAIAEARVGGAQGERADGAVFVLDDAMVARAHEQVAGSGDPTAHAVMLALREATRRLGRAGLAGISVFVTREPCTMCVGALLEGDVDTLVYAVPDEVDGAAGGAIQLARNDVLQRHLRVVSGILHDDALDALEGETRAAGAGPR